MAPRKLGDERKVTALLDFATRVQRRLDANKLDSSLTEDLDTRLRTPLPRLSTSDAARFDAMGTSIWNASIRLRDRGAAVVIPALIPRLRAFAFLILDLCHQAIHRTATKTTTNVVRIMRTALKAIKTCLQDDELELCVKICEKAAAYAETTHKDKGPKMAAEEEREQFDVIEQLSAEYFVLRATLAWKQDRHDTLEFWLSKVMLTGGRAAASGLAEKKTDLMYEIAKQALKTKEYELAVKWLQKGLETLDAFEKDELSDDSCELRLTIIHDLVTALLGLNSHESIAKAGSLVQILRLERGQTMSTSLLQLKVLFAQQPVAGDEFLSTLLQMIHPTILTDNTIKTILHEVLRLKNLNATDGRPNRSSADLACQALDQLLPRLFDARGFEKSWLEKATVLRVWITISEDCDAGPDHIDKLRDLFDEVYHSRSEPFTSAGAHAAQSLIWKRIDRPNDADPRQDTECWISLACHPLFQKTGDLNKSKLGRRMILSAVSKGDIAKAKEAFYQMPESGRSTGLTRYLMYKAALQSRDVELAAQSLEGVLKASGKDATCLYACALAAQQQGDRLQTILVLQKVLEHYQYSIPEGVYLPAMLRVVIVGLMMEMEEGAMSADIGLPEICKAFEGAMSQVRTFTQHNAAMEDDSNYRTELKWFACHGYNLALKHFADMDPELLVKYMVICIAFVDLLRQVEQNDRFLVQRLMLCRFLAASALIVLARAEDDVERSLQHYLDSRRQIEAFRKLHRQLSRLGNSQENTDDDIDSKEFELLKYDLEAVYKLGHWADLDAVLEACMAQRHTERWGSIADLILHIGQAGIDEQHQAKIPAVVEKMINLSWRQHKDLAQLSRWIRCLFQMTLTFDPMISLKCLNQAQSIAIRAKGTATLYPQDELIWLATTAFNHAVDLFCAQDSDGSRLWAETALNLAMATCDGSGLHEVLQGKWLRMQSTSK